MTAFVIRPVVATDVAEVVAFVAASLAEFGLEFGVGATTDDALRELPASYAGHGGAFWVALEGDRLVGTAGVFPVGPHIYELRKMYLDDRVRGHGLGRRLLETAVAWARGQGGRQLVLDTMEKMTRAIEFYETHGFVRDDTQRRGARCSRGYAREL